jgi:hypothetical protein
MTRATLLSAALLLLAPPVLAAGAVPAGGVQGLVKQPEAGMCLAGDPCDGVGRGIVLVFFRVGQPVHRVRSDATGHFKLRLAPGRYRLRAGDSALHATPGSVLVPKAGFARVTVTVGNPGVMP